MLHLKGFAFARVQNKLEQKCSAKRKESMYKEEGIN